MMRNLGYLGVFIALVGLSPSCFARTSPDGYHWVQQESGTRATLTCADGISSNRIVVGGTGNTLLLFDGTSWADFPQWKEYLESGFWKAKRIGDVALDAHGHPHVVGDSNSYARYDGTAWHSVNVCDETGELRQIWIDRISGIVLTGGRGNVIYQLSWDKDGHVRIEKTHGGYFKSRLICDIAGTDIRHVWATVDTPAFGVRRLGKLFSFSPAGSEPGWLLQVPPGGILVSNPRHMHFLSEESILFGGYGDISLGIWDAKRDPSTLYPFPVQPNSAIRAIYSRGLDKIWILDADGQLVFFDGSIWQPIPLGTKAELRGIMGLEEGAQLWTFGSQGTIFHGAPKEPQGL